MKLGDVVVRAEVDEVVEKVITFSLVLFQK